MSFKTIRKVVTLKIMYNYVFVFQMIRGDFLVIEYLEWDNCYSEIVPKDRLRVKTTKTPIDKNTFHKFEISVPEDLRD